ncbi:hypothetical protein [Xanthocytophaga agilis]|uniref:Uncharacterized protein n=1 Tax=Xanthocytophaga agilis TaxID=3048010 RepID=A0AAE3R160_9BACT|nr:hypothetical protein [Xanthocytophaga agilis]MDJ1501851.1 hypothetical protein [Xanthocytophaga agilis]
MKTSMKSAKSNSLITDTTLNASAAQAAASQTESKATMPVIPSSAPDVEAEGTASFPSPAPDMEEENNSILYNFLWQRIQKMILSYGETEQEALREFNYSLEFTYNTLLKVIAFEKVRLANVDYQTLVLRFKNLVSSTSPIDFDEDTGKYILYSAKQVGCFLLNDILNFAEPDYSKIDSLRLSLNTDFMVILQTIIRGDKLRDVREIQSMSRPLNDILETLSVYKSLVEPDSHLPGPEKSAA